MSVADINECDSSPCENGCTCADAINGYSCGSIAGYTGTHCETGKKLVGLFRFQQHKVKGKVEILLLHSSTVLCPLYKLHADHLAIAHTQAPLG